MGINMIQLNLDLVCCLILLLAINSYIWSWDIENNISVASGDSPPCILRIIHVLTKYKFLHFFRFL